ncbi:MAG: hypothetical protein RIS35_3057 [Pseudomonadota bacterium]
MLRVLEVTLPVFALVFCGFLGQRRGMLPKGVVEGLNAFVFQFALPAMIFRIVAKQPPESFADWRYLGGYLSASLAVYLIARNRTLAARKTRTPADRSRATAFALHTTHGNVGYLGVPLAIELGGGIAAPMILAVMADIFVVIALSIALLEIDRRDAGPDARSGAGSLFVTVFSGLARSPLVLSIAAGLAWSLAGPPLPDVADTFTRILGGAAGPCALFAIGASLGDRRVVIDRTVGALVGAKLLLHPLLAAVALTAFGCDARMVAAGVLAASLPGASNSFIIASRYGVETREITAALLVGTFAGLATVSLVIWLSGLGPG